MNRNAKKMRNPKTVNVVIYSEQARLPAPDDHGYRSLKSMENWCAEANKRLKGGSYSIRNKDFFIGGLPDSIELIARRTVPVQGNLFIAGSAEQMARNEQLAISALEAEAEKLAADNAQRLAARASKHNLTAAQVDLELGVGKKRRMTKTFFNLHGAPKTAGTSLAGPIVVGGRIPSPTDFPGTNHVVLIGCRLCEVLKHDSVELRFERVVHDGALRVPLDDEIVRCKLSGTSEALRSTYSLLHGVMFADAQFDCVATEMLSTKKRNEWYLVFERFVDPSAVLKQISAITKERLAAPELWSQR